MSRFRLTHSKIDNSQKADNRNLKESFSRRSPIPLTSYARPTSNSPSTPSRFSLFDLYTNLEMTSSAQATANQTNAQFSTGPRTEPGKAASSQNGTQHGLTSTFTVLSYESQPDFDGLTQRLSADLQPAGEHESFLDSQRIQSRWRIERTTRLESAAFEYMIFGSADASPEDHIVAKMFEKGGDPISALNRYRAAAERTYHKCYRELLNGRQVAQKMQIKATDNYIKNVVFAPPPGQASPNGFASQNAPAASPAPAAQSKAQSFSAPFTNKS